MAQAVRHILFIALTAFATGAPVCAATTFNGIFAPAAGIVHAEEKPFRQELCLNGKWQFAPVEVPRGHARNRGEPPALPEPTPDGWDPTPLKVPSPWNVNTWGNGRNVGPGTAHPYWPDSVYYPSYPAKWDGIEMGWLRRSFRLPAGWHGGRLVLHFEAVGGECQVRINGKPVGSHFDSYLPFDLDVTDAVHPDGDNELLLGIRAHSLFDLQDPRYAKMRKPYPCGSNTDRITGIWQDVFLLHLPDVHITDAFVQPWVDRHQLQVDLTIRNDTDRPESVTVSGDVAPWVNATSGDTLAAATPTWKLGDLVVSLDGASELIPAHSSRILTVHQSIAEGTLRLWSPSAPNLYVVQAKISVAGQLVDATSTRFGWRQFSIRGQDLLLNGQKLQLVGDLLHPFGPFVLSRSYAWAWYRMIKDMGGNAVRLHAQPHPRHFLDLADEMGLVVLDETAIFGSAVSLNFAPAVAWDRFADHYDDLVRRDRNHPAVLGWSFGNELFAIFNLNNVTSADADRWYAQLAALGHRAYQLDPTRQWISCDGDEDLRGTLPVYSKHFGLGLPPADRLPDIGKPLMVGESGGSYYAHPSQLAVFNGDDAFGNYAARNDALGIDVYDNIVHLAKPRLAYYSASETAWFGIEHLNFGYRDFTKLPNADDGVHITSPYVDGQPGIQPERLPPYVATFNPGWDDSLPLYRPLGMFKAEQAALAAPGAQPCRWDHRRVEEPPSPAPAATIDDRVRFVGAADGPLATRLRGLGVPLVVQGSASLTIVDGDTADGMPPATGTTLVMTRGDGARLPSLLKTDVQLTSRDATALNSNADDPWTRSMTRSRLYFAETPEPNILRHGMAGPFVDHGRVLLNASDTDWSQFNNAPEAAKCGAAVLYEHLRRPSGAALVAVDTPAGRLAACTLDYAVASSAADAMWRMLFANMGVKLNDASSTVARALDGEVLVAARSIGRFEKPIDPRSLTAPGVDRKWTTVRTRDRFMVRESGDGGPSVGPATAYYSFWVKSPRATDDLLTGGPDAPRFNLLCYVADRCRLFVNDRELKPTRAEPADYRRLLTFDGVALTRGWNHILIEVSADHIEDRDHPASLAVRMSASNAADLRQLDSAIGRPHD